MAYMPLAQNHETGMTLYVRASVPPASLVAQLRREIQALEPNLPVPNIRTMTDTIGTSLYAARMGAWLLAVFGGLALVLAVVGIYGVLSFSVSRRTREMGIRLALGADSHRVFLLVVRDGMLLVGVGILIGLAGGLAGARALASSLQGVSATDLPTFTGTIALLTHRRAGGVRDSGAAGDSDQPDHGAPSGVIAGFARFSNGQIALWCISDQLLSTRGKVDTACCS